MTNNSPGFGRGSVPFTRTDDAFGAEPFWKGSDARLLLKLSPLRKETSCGFKKGARLLLGPFVTWDKGVRSWASFLSRGEGICLQFQFQAWRSGKVPVCPESSIKNSSASPRERKKYESPEGGKWKRPALPLEVSNSRLLAQGCALQLGGSERVGASSSTTRKHPFGCRWVRISGAKRRHPIQHPAMHCTRHPFRTAFRGNPIFPSINPSFLLSFLSSCMQMCM